MLNSLFNIIILLGSIQGIIIGSLLFFSKNNQRPNRILATLIFLISMACLNLYGNYRDWFHVDILRFITQLLPMVIVMPMGPLLYFYLQAVLNPDFTITKKQRFHFYPVLVDLVPSLIVIIYIAGFLTKLVKNSPGPWGQFIDDYNVYADIPRWISFSTYLWLSHKHLRTFKATQTMLANGQAVQVKWLQQFTFVFIVFQSIWLVYLVPYVIPRYTNWMLDTFEWYPVYIPLAVLIYWLGIKGWMMSQQLQLSADSKAAVPATPLSTELVQQVSNSLKTAMQQDKLFLNPNLNLSLVAAAAGYPPKTISAVLNQHLQKSFNEFINGYRVEAFKEKMLQPEMNNFTIAGIALECGFSSQATFQRVFKELTGQSPTAFRKSATLIL